MTMQPPAGRKTSEGIVDRYIIATRQAATFTLQCAALLGAIDPKCNAAVVTRAMGQDALRLLDLTMETDDDTQRLAGLAGLCNMAAVASEILLAYRAERERQATHACA